jgi:hypothetical protein
MYQNKKGTESFRHDNGSPGKDVFLRRYYRCYSATLFGTR